MFGSSFAMEMKFKLVLCDPLPYKIVTHLYVTASDGLPTSAISTGTSSGGILSRTADPHETYSEMVQCVSVIFLHLIVVRASTFD